MPWVIASTLILAAALGAVLGRILDPFLDSPDATTDPGPQPLPTGPVIRIVGDSQACWCGGLTTDLNPDHSFLRGVTVIGPVVCKIGSRVADWNSHINQVPVQPGDWVFVFLGSNELGNTPDPTTILRSILARGGHPIWVGPPLIRHASGPAVQSLRQGCAAVGVPYYDTPTALVPPLQQKDGVHPLNAGEAYRWLLGAMRFAGFTAP